MKYFSQLFDEFPVWDKRMRRNSNRIYLVNNKYGNSHHINKTLESCTLLGLYTICMHKQVNKDQDFNVAIFVHVVKSADC